MKTNHQAIAQTILQAQATNVAIEAFSQKNSLTLDDAYAIQKIVCNEWEQRGDKPLGKKVAFANAASQQGQGLTEPAFATIFSSGLLDSSRPVSLANLPAAIIEAEITFLLKDDLQGKTITTAHVLTATEAVFASFEIVSCRMNNSCGLDKIASNVCFGGIVLGSKGVCPTSLDLRTLGIVLEKNGQVVATAAGAAVLDNPANSVAWLANTLIQRGDFLKKGDLVMSGCAPAAQPITVGDCFTAHFAHLGTVSAVFCQ